MNDFLKSLLDSIAKFAATAGLRILGAILILIIGTKLIKWCLKLIKKGKKFESFPPNVQTLIVVWSRSLFMFC